MRRLIVSAVWLALLLLLGSGLESLLVGDSGPRVRWDYDFMSMREIAGVLLYNPVSPEARSSVFTLAAAMARQGTVTDSAVWLSLADDPAGTFERAKLPPILLTSEAGAPLNPEFQRLPLAFAVLLWPQNWPQNIAATAPSTTPLIWTRGLQPDGTWRDDNPFYGQGGWIIPVDYGSHYFHSALTMENTPLVKWGTDEKTVNLAEALPPGAGGVNMYPCRE